MAVPPQSSADGGGRRERLGQTSNGPCSSPGGDRQSERHEAPKRGRGQGGQAQPLADGRLELARQESLLSLMAASPRLQRQCACGAPSAGGGSCVACEAKVSPGAGQKLQAKLAIGPADDPLEREADQVAERVTRMEAPSATPLDLGQHVRPMVSRSTEGAAVAGEAPASVHATLASPGQPLAPSVRAFFEPRFGADFSQVRVHTDDLAQQSARDAHALAYTVGSHVVFGAGRYAPSSPEGQRLLAHELAHVVQQSQAELRVRREEVWEGEQLDAEQAAGQAPRETCGPEISKALDKTLNDVQSKFVAANRVTRDMACLTLISVATGGFAWDIHELNSDAYKDWIGHYQGCATEACGSSVAVSGQCHYPDTVNYALFGTAMRLCYNYYRNVADKYAEEYYSEEAMKTYISSWKKAKVWKSVFGKTHEAGATNWAVLGWHGYKPGRVLSAELPDCDPSCGDYLGEFTWTWLGLHTPKADE
jgi:hypothetical protein